MVCLDSHNESLFCWNSKFILFDFSLYIVMFQVDIIIASYKIFNFMRVWTCAKISTNCQIHIKNECLNPEYQVIRLSVSSLLVGLFRIILLFPCRLFVSLSKVYLSLLVHYFSKKAFLVYWTSSKTTQNSSIQISCAFEHRIETIDCFSLFSFIKL